MLVCANFNQPWNSPLSALTLLPKCRTQMDVNQIYARLLTTGLIKDSCLTTKLILTLCSSPHPPLVQFARHLFFFQHAYRNPQNQEDPFLWNAIIKSFSHGNDPKRALVVFCSMLENGVFVDKFSFSLVLKACSKLGFVNQGMQIHGLLAKSQIGRDVFIQNCLMCLYLRCGCLELSRQLFDRMSNRDSVSFNLMIDGYIKCGLINSAHYLFDSMPIEAKNLISWNTMIRGCLQMQHGFGVACELFKQMPERDLVSWNLMLNCCVKHGGMDIARTLFNQMPERDVVSWANMIDGYAKIGNVSVARGLFDDMPERDVISCNAMMTGYVCNGYYLEALKVYQDMLCGSDLLPDDATLLIALSAVSQLGNIDEGVAIHCYIEDNGLNVRGKLGVGLIDMYTKCGWIENALHVFENVKEKNVDHWNAMIGGLAIHGLGDLAFNFFIEMERLSVKPDDITFIGVLNACGHSGMVKEGLMCFEIMRTIHKMEPRVQHYGCIVDMLGRSGHIQEAIKFIAKMPVEPNDVVWRSLLSACKNHENLKIGEPVAEYLIQQNLHNTSSYVLLSNMYARFGMWEYVRRIRTIMKEMDLKKVPGRSCIELEGTVHQFFVGDTLHSQATEIYSTLDRCLALNLEVASML